MDNMFEKDQLNSLVNSCQEEIRRLKKQLPERPKEYVFIGHAQNKTRDFINQITKENKILKQNAENNDKVVDKVNWENMMLKKENKQLKEEKRKVRDYINKHCVNEKISKEVGYKCYTMADTNELEKIMKILGDI